MNIELVNWQARAEALESNNAELIRALHRAQARNERLNKENSAFHAEVGRLRDQIISGFYEDDYPYYTRGEPEMELQSVATAEELNTLVQKLKDKDAEIVQLHQAVYSLQILGSNNEAP